MGFVRLAHATTGVGARRNFIEMDDAGDAGLAMVAVDPDKGTPRSFGSNPTVPPDTCGRTATGLAQAGARQNSSRTTRQLAGLSSQATSRWIRAAMLPLFGGDSLASTGADYIWVNRYTPGGGWSTPTSIDEEHGGRSAVVAAPNGDVTVVWPLVWARRYTPSVGWGPAVRIGVGTDTDAAVDPNGNVIAVWSGGANRYTPSGGWGTAVDIGNVKEPRVAVDLSGNAIVVGRTLFAPFDIVATSFKPSEGWGTVEQIDVGPGSAQLPDVAVDSEGNAMAVWMQDDGIRYNIWARRYTPGLGWGTAELVEDDDSGHASNPKVTVDRDGIVTAVWRKDLVGIRASRYMAGRGWGTPVRVDAIAGDANNPSLGVDPSGAVTVVWHQTDGYRFSIWSNRFE